MYRPQSQKRKSSPIRALLLLTQPTVLVLVIAIVFMQWRIPTLIQIDFAIALPEFLSKEEILISAWKTGNLYSPLVIKGTLQYPNFPKLEDIPFSTFEKIQLTPTGQFQVKEISRDSARQEIQFRLSGMAEQLQIASEGVLYDRRLTKFDEVKHSLPLMCLGFAAWGLLTAVGWFKIYQELKR